MRSSLRAGGSAGGEPYAGTVKASTMPAPLDFLRYGLIGLVRPVVHRFPALRRLRRNEPPLLLYGVPVPSSGNALEQRLPLRVRAIVRLIDDALTRHGG